MAYRSISYGNDIIVEINIFKNVNIPEQAVNKALMITMNYLIENMEIIEQKEPE